MHTLRLLDAWAAVGLAKGIGLDCIRDGTLVVMPAGTLAVNAECSGERSIGVLCLLVLVVCLMRRRRVGATAALVAGACALGWFGNLLRLLTVIGCYAQSKAFAAWVHEWGGYPIFAVEVLIMTAMVERRGSGVRG